LRTFRCSYESVVLHVLRAGQVTGTRWRRLSRVPWNFGGGPGDYQATF
jgi:hypothetical protein